MIPMVFLLMFDLDKNVIAISLLNSAMLAGIIFLGLRFRENYTFSNRSFPVSMFFVAFFLIMSLSVVIDPLLNLLPRVDLLDEAFDELRQYPALLFFSIVVSAPILEELLFRGIILDGFLKNYSPLKSILVSALMFGIIHMNFQQGIGAFFFGIIIGFLYWQTRSMLLCILLHWANNFIAFIGMLYFSEFDTTVSLKELTGSNLSLYLFNGICILITLGCGWFLWSKYINHAKVLITLQPVMPQPEVEKSQAIVDEQSEPR